MSHGNPCRAEGCYCEQLTYTGTAKAPVTPECGPCYRLRHPPKHPPPAAHNFTCYHTSAHPIPTLGRDCFYCLAENVAAEQVYYELRYAPSPACMREMLQLRLQGVYRYKSSCCGTRGGTYMCFCGFSEETVQDLAVNILEKKHPGYKQWLYKG